jgi:serine/threonine-protein kinase
VAELGSGSVFHVARVLAAGEARICKRLRSGLAGEPLALAALERERGALGLAHGLASVPRLIAHGEDGAGPFLLESEIAGATLSQLAARGPLPAALLAAVAAAAFAALAELHARAICHGDLAPDHLFVGTRRGQVGFIDFGMASWPERPPGPGERGTLPYVAPEVARGEAPWSEASDVYALAATLAFGALGRPPCASAGPALLAEISERGLDPAAVADLGPLARALAFEPSARIRRARDLAAALSSSRGE